MNTSSNGYVLGFAVTICVAMSASLALVANGLKPIQDAAREFDRQKNVMLAAGLIEAGDPRPRPELEQLYRDRVEEFVLDTESGERAADKTPADVALFRTDAERERYRVVAVTKDGGGAIAAYVLPISGKGLWSTLYGYLALESDGNTVRGITFYQHGETPGLGGEVENPQWTAQWKGKQILDDGELVSITIKKGEVNESIEAERAHYVDGLAGATITCNGVTRFLKADLAAFQPFLAKAWK